MYTFISNLGHIIKTEDGSLIAPCNDTNNIEYQNFLGWQQAGGELVVTDSPGEHYEYINGEWSLKLDYLKELKIQEVKDAFSYQFQFGKFLCSFGFEVDNRRYGDKNDKDNLNSLIELGIPFFKDANNETHQLTIEQLTTLRNEMAMDSLKKYQTKWYFEGLILATNDPVLLNEIVISF